MALRNETEVVVNRETIQTSSTEIICLKTSLELQEDKLGRLEGLIKHQETNLGFQEWKLERLENLIKQKDDQIQALSDRIDALCQPVHQKVAAEVISPVLPDPHHLWEQQKEQEFRELLQL